MIVTAKDLRFHSKILLESVKRGEDVLITYRGKPYAKLVPVDEEKSEKGDNKLFGIWKDYKAVSDVDEYIDELRKSRF